MIRTLSARERKLIAVALLLAVVALIWAIVIGPVISGFASRAEQRTQLRAEYQRNSRLINAIPALRRRAEKQQSVRDQLVIAAPNATLARDRLRERLRREFTVAGGQVTAVQDLPGQPGAVSVITMPTSFASLISIV